MSSQTQNLQIKLSLDEGLQNVWKYLSQEYQGLDKASIVRLALSTLAKTTRRQEAEVLPLDASFKKLDDSREGMTEEEFFEWWNKNKPFGT